VLLAHRQPASAVPPRPQRRPTDVVGGDNSVAELSTEKLQSISAWAVGATLGVVEVNTARYVGVIYVAVGRVSSASRV
jgi:hypothetical protein